MSREGVPLRAGENITVYCADHDQWYNGTVERCRPEDESRILVRFRNEDDAEWIDAANNLWRRSTNPGSWVLPEEVLQFQRRKKQSIEKLRVGSRVSVWWPLEKQNYTGTLTTILPRTNAKEKEEEEDPENLQPHFIKYDDGDEQWINLYYCKFETYEELTVGSRVTVQGGKLLATITKIRTGRARPHLIEYDDKRKGKEWLNLNAIPFLAVDDSADSTSTGEFFTSAKKRKHPKSPNSVSQEEPLSKKKKPTTIRPCQEMCGICISPAQRPRAIGCHHIFCKRCIKSHFNITKNSPKTSCPICNTTLRKEWMEYDPDHVSFRPVQAFDKLTGRLFASYSTASAASLESPGVVAIKIIRACLGDREKQEHRGLVWRFCEDEEESSAVGDEPFESSVRESKDSSGPKKPAPGEKGRRSTPKNGLDRRGGPRFQKQKKVEQLCLQTGKVLRTFDSLVLAAKAHGITTGGISKCCNFMNGAKSAGGFGWRFAPQNDG